ncbi:MAG: FAD:protein FMN transferase [Gammaproteobacteria bacterium]|nr:FAD:protein FMN transferase [Gammaproteobacteria bacterium]
MKNILKYKLVLLIVLTASIYWLFFYLPNAKEQSKIEPLAVAGRTMGTSFSIKITQPLSKEQLQKIQNDIKQTLENFNLIFSHWDKNSELSHFNQSKPNEVFNSSEALYQLLLLSKQISQKTNGAYDPTIAPSVNIWGFGPGEIRFEPPKDSEVLMALSQVNYQNLDLSNKNQLIKSKPFSLDLSAIAKGGGVDSLAALMDKYKIENYLIEIGGEIKTKGVRHPGQNWRIAIESPFTSKTGRKVHRIINIPQAAYSIATSGNYRNFFNYEGKHYSHTLDPKTGQPISNKIASLTVLLPTSKDSTAEVDALATALTVMGKDKALSFAEKHLLAVLIMTIEDGKVHEFSSSKFKEMNF